MTELNIQKYLGMAIHFMYYYYDDLVGKRSFYEDICADIKTKLGEYYGNMKTHVKFGIDNLEMCYSQLVHPFLDTYTKEEVYLFLKLFYNKLEDCENAGD